MVLRYGWTTAAHHFRATSSKALSRMAVVAASMGGQSREKSRGRQPTSCRSMSDWTAVRAWDTRPRSGPMSPPSGVAWSASRTKATCSRYSSSGTLRDAGLLPGSANGSGA
jgi:hypothetical protein